MNNTTRSVVTVNTSQAVTLSSLFNYEHPANHMLSVVTCIIGSLGLPGNVFLLFIMSKNFKARKPHEWLLFNLAVIDLFLCLNNAVLEPIYISKFTHIGCKISAFAEYFFGLLNFTMPPIIAYNRYLALNNMLLFKVIFTPRKICAMCFGPWMFGFFFFSPFIFTNSLGLDELGLCGIQETSLGLDLLVSVGLCPLIFLGYVISVCCGYKIIRKIISHSTDLMNEIQSRVVEESKEITLLLILLLVVPVISQMPGVSAKMLHVFFRLDPWISRSLVAPFSLTSACNAYLTLFIVKAYRKEAKKLLCCNKQATVHPCTSSTPHNVIAQQTTTY